MGETRLWCLAHAPPPPSGAGGSLIRSGGSRTRRTVIQSLAEATLDRVVGRLGIGLDALAEAPPRPLLFRPPVDTVAEAPDAALAGWTRPAADALVEAVFDLLRRGGMFGFERMAFSYGPELEVDSRGADPLWGPAPIRARVVYAARLSRKWRRPSGWRAPGAAVEIPASGSTRSAPRSRVARDPA